MVATARAVTGSALLRFRCTGCGNCCKEPLLPVTHEDVARICRRTGHRAANVVRFVSRDEIDLDDDEDFVTLRVGERVMVLGHRGGGCRYLGRDDRCTIYSSRPLGCRVFPFDAEFTRTGKLRRLTLIQATDCRYELDGHNEVEDLRATKDAFDAATARYHRLVAEFNAEQRHRRESARALRTGADFLRFLQLQ